MLKQLLNDDLYKNPIIRSSKSDEVVRNLLFYLAKYIGPHTLELVQLLCPDNISESESLELDDVISGNRFSLIQTETAAGIVLKCGTISFNAFHAVLMSR